MSQRRVLVAGGSGCVGKTIIKYFREKLKDNVDFTIVSRSSSNHAGVKTVTWDEIERSGTPDCDVAISIMGASIIDHRWSASRKQELHDSRIKNTNLLVKRLSDKPPQAFVSASAVGVYPTGTENHYSEFSPINTPPEKMTFPQQLCLNWESAAFEAKELMPDCSTSVIRIGSVVGPQQNLMKNLLTPFKLGLGGPIGSGTQPFPWIHERDLAAMFFRASFYPGTTPDVINGVAPDVITQAEFAQALGSALGKPAVLPLPAFVVKLMFQERASLLLDGAVVLPRAFPDFKYEFPDIHAAMKDVVANL